jgi:hypothetical protein
VLPVLHRFCADHACDLSADLRFPQELLHHPMHLDPDFECLTYGDEGARRGAGGEEGRGSFRGEVGVAVGPEHEP